MAKRRLRNCCLHDGRTALGQSFTDLI
jgi:hypothetical protein